MLLVLVRPFNNTYHGQKIHESHVLECNKKNSEGKTLLLKYSDSPSKIRAALKF